MTSLRSQAVLAHDLGGTPAARGGEFEVPVAGDDDESVALHPTDRLGDGGPGMAQALRDPGTESNDVLLLEFKDGPQVHLGGVDEVRHAVQLLGAVRVRGWSASRR
jgi:hypothetical protein